MKHYYKEVKEVMKGLKTPEDFVIAIYGEDYDWAKLIAARKIFIEDGGDPTVFDNYNWKVKFPEGVRIDTNFF